MNRSIGIFDSGIGGVTVLREMIKILPNENYIYYSDSIHNPYGEKKQEDILSYVEEIMKFFIDKNCKAVVFACNTATALTIDIIRKKYSDLIIIGIEPAYKMVHDYAKNKKTLIMATPATLKSKKFLNLYHKYDNHNTILLACPLLAGLIEKGNEKEINNYLTDKLKNIEVEVVVLGCTHYPLIKENIKNVLGNVVFFDGGKGVSLRLKKLLDENNLLFNNGGNIYFYDSMNSKSKENRFYELLN